MKPFLTVTNDARPSCYFCTYLLRCCSSSRFQPYATLVFTRNNISQRSDYSDWAMSNASFSYIFPFRRNQIPLTPLLSQDSIFNAGT